MTKLAFLLTLTWVAQAGAAVANDFPTTARVDYVFGCMASNGQNQEMLERCSCSIDTIASLMPYKRYLQAETILRMGQIGGEKEHRLQGRLPLQGDRRRPEARPVRGRPAVLLSYSTKRPDYEPASGSIAQLLVNCVSSVSQASTVSSPGPSGTNENRKLGSSLIEIAPSTVKFVSPP